MGTIVNGALSAQMLAYLKHMEVTDQLKASLKTAAGEFLSQHFGGSWADVVSLGDIKLGRDITGSKYLEDVTITLNSQHTGNPLPVSLQIDNYAPEFSGRRFQFIRTYTRYRFRLRALHPVAAARLIEQTEVSV